MAAQGGKPAKDLFEDGRDVAFQTRLLDHLVQNKRLDGRSRERALSAAQQSGHRLDRVLLELALIGEQEFASSVSELLDIPLADDALLRRPAVLLEGFPTGFLQSSSMYCTDNRPDSAVFLINDPFALDTLRSLSFLLGKPVRVFLAPRRLIDEKLAQITEVNISDDSTSISQSNDLERLKELANAAPIVKIVSRIFSTAIASQASDIHFEPMSAGLRVRFRIDGILKETEYLRSDLQNAIVSRIKVLARLNIAESRLPQDGRASHIIDGREVDLRVSTMPVQNGENVVLRILEKNRVLGRIESLGFEAGLTWHLEKLFSRPHGLVLVTGPTGSGKTTTLYSALQQLNTEERKLFTVEDPIEYDLPGINQIQVQPNIDLTFVRALRSVLRQDPDIIMIGEMRDAETARIAIQAALTGHLVLSTLHTNSAAAAITRLADLGLERYLISTTVAGVLAQRLVRRLCDCAQVEATDSAAGQNVAVDRKADEVLRTPKGCEDCRHSGFRGRTALGELLIFTDEVKAAVLGAADESWFSKHIIGGGLMADGMRKAQSGQTTISEVMRVVEQ